MLPSTITLWVATSFSLMGKPHPECLSESLLHILYCLKTSKILRENIFKKIMYAFEVTYFKNSVLYFKENNVGHWDYKVDVRVLNKSHSRCTWTKTASMSRILVYLQNATCLKPNPNSLHFSPLPNDHYTTLSVKKTDHFACYAFYFIPKPFSIFCFSSYLGAPHAIV